MARFITILFIIILSISTVFAFDTERKMSLSADKLKELEIECGAGFLEVEGVNGLDEIYVVAHIILNNVDEDKAERIMKRKMKLSLEKRGNKARLISHMDFSTGSFLSELFSGNISARINLTVKMPAGMELSVDDGSGDMEVVHIKNDVNIKDGSGRIKVKNIEGELDINDGSGDIRVFGVKGRTEISDGSGEIELKEINGDVRINDGSGYLEIIDVKGDVDIVDGSGSLVVEKVNGSVEIRDGSGSITVENIEHDLVIREAGSGFVNIRRVKGRIERYDD